MKHILSVYLLTCFLSTPILFQCKSKAEGLKEMHSLAISRFHLPGEAQFPLNAMYSKPANKAEEGIQILIFSLQNKSSLLGA